MIGKVDIPIGLPSRLEQQGLQLIDITTEHAGAIRQILQVVKHDPFDRLIIAQAQLTGARLLTADATLLALGRGFVVDAAR
jgi:PIN domain nuclease of toxin-antitoxin system